MADPNIGYGKPSEGQIDQYNRFMRSQPWYLDYLRSIGQNPDRVKLSKSQSSQLLKIAQANGAVVDEGDLEIDPAGNFNPIGHKLRNTLVAAGVAGAGLTGLGLAGIGPLGGLGGAAAAAPVAAPTLTAGLPSGLSAGALSTGALTGAAPLAAGGASAVLPSTSYLGSAVLPSAAQSIAAGTTGAGMNIGQLIAQYGPSVVGNLLQRQQGVNANNQANQYLQDAVNEGKGLQQQLYDSSTGAARQAFDQQNSLYAPYQQTAAQSLAALAGLAGQNRADLQQRPDFTLPTLDEARAMPGYQFGLDNGLKGVSRSAAARGGLLTGAAAKAADRYATDYATSKYDNLVNQKLAAYNTNTANDLNVYGANTANFDRPFNRALTLAGLGQYGTTGAANASQNYADSVGRAGSAYTGSLTDLITGGANANAGKTLNNGRINENTIGSIADLISQALSSKYGA